MVRFRRLITRLVDSPEQVEEVIDKISREMLASGFSVLYTHVIKFDLGKMKREWDADGVHLVEEVYQEKYLVLMAFEVMEDGRRMGRDGVHQSRGRGQAYSPVCP